MRGCLGGCVGRERAEAGNGRGREAKATCLYYYCELILINFFTYAEYGERGGDGSGGKGDVE